MKTNQALSKRLQRARNEHKGTAFERFSKMSKRDLAQLDKRVQVLNVKRDLGR